VAVNTNTINTPIGELKDPNKPDTRCKWSKTDAEWRQLIWDANNEAEEEFRKQLFFGAATATERLLSAIIQGKLPVKLLGQSAGIMMDKYKMFSEMKNEGYEEPKDPMVVIEAIRVTIKGVLDRPGNKKFIPGVQSKWLGGPPVTDGSDETE
jgi:hypothetical protein